MKIIAGNFKGKKLNFIKSETTRPLRNFVKENIFNIISHSNIIKKDIRKAKVLDLYSGIGSFGIECISRNASFVTFVDKDIKAISILEKNLKTLRIKENYEINNVSIEDFIFSTKSSKKFDIFFFDPPYRDYTYTNIVHKIKKKNLHSNNHIVIIHRESNSSEKFGEIINVKLVKNYGRSKVIFGKF